MEQNNVSQEEKDTFLGWFGKRKPSFGSIIGAVLVIVAISMAIYASVSVVYILRNLREVKEDIARLDTLTTRTSELLLGFYPYISTGFVDLTVPNIQNIGDGFYVSQLSVEPHLTGVVIKGRVVNATSLNHSTASFIVTVAARSNTFTVNRITSGRSTRFEVYVPDVSLEETKSGTIKFERSMVGYGY